MINPLLRDIPSHLETERLLMRVPRAGDGAAVYAAAVASREALQLRMAWANPEIDRDAIEMWVRERAISHLRREDLPTLLIERETGICVGTCSLFRLNWDVGSAEIGYWLRTDRTGRGYMREAVMALTVAGFNQLGLHRIVIRTDEDNADSYRVAEACGYQLEGILRDDDWDARHTHRVSTRVYARIREMR